MILDIFKTLQYMKTKFVHNLKLIEPRKKIFFIDFN